jgi:hypothetical protein
MSAPLHIINWIFPPKFLVALYSLCVLFGGAHTLDTLPHNRFYFPWFNSTFRFLCCYRCRIIFAAEFGANSYHRCPWNLYHRCPRSRARTPSDTVSGTSPWISMSAFFKLIDLGLLFSSDNRNKNSVVCKAPIQYYTSIPTPYVHAGGYSNPQLYCCWGECDGHCATPTLQQPFLL